MRIGNFTSSEIFALLTNGKKEGSLGAPAITYINEKNIERRLGRPLDNEQSARSTGWGKLVERYVASLLPLEYSAVSKNFILHPFIDCWGGTPDSVVFEEGLTTVADIKSPFTLKSFCTLVDLWEAGGIAAIKDGHKEGARYYWQLVSNAILTGCDTAELIVFCPYQSELNAIRELARHDDYAWISYAPDSEIPYLLDGGYYKNLNKMRFEIPEADKKALTARVEEARKFLIVPQLTQ